MTDEQERIWRPDEIAFELWCWKAHRSDKQTLQLLRELGPDYHDITIKDIQKWKRTYAWAVLADNAIKDLAPGIHNEMIGGLIIAGLKAQRVLDGILEDWSEHKQAPPKEVISMIDVAFKYSGASPTANRDPTEKVHTGRASRHSSMLERYISPERLEQIKQEEEQQSGMLPEFSGGDES